MKNTLKKVVSAVVAVLVVIGAMPAINFSLNKKSSAVTTITSGWFYSEQLNAVEKRFYDAIASAYLNGTFKSGGSFDLVANGVVSVGDVAEYAQGNSVLISAFNVAKDAYLFDHPELFWVDFEKLSLRLGTQNGKYVAVLDSGKNIHYFNDTLNTLGVGSAIISFNGENGFFKFLPTNSTDAQDKVIQVARNIANNVQPSAVTDYNNAYFASVGNATAEGYAKLFKLCMDKLNIRSAVVCGYLAGESFDTISRHYWNVVEIDGRWLAVDVYLNDSSASEDYLLVREEQIQKHIAKISVFGDKAFDIPDIESFKIERSYTKNNMLVEVLYNEMNASQLLYHEELYIVQVLSESTETVSARALFNDTLQSSKIVVDNELSSVAYAVTATAPDDGVDYDSLNKSDLIVMQTFENEVLFKDIIRPIVSTITATNIGSQAVIDYDDEQSLAGEDAWHIKITYDDDIKQTGSNVGVVVKLNGQDVTSISNVTNVTWNESSANVVEFDFKPAKLYLSQDIMLGFELDGFVSAVTNNDTTLARPAYIKFDFQSENIASLSQSNVVWKDDNVPYLEAGTNVTAVTLKDSLGAEIQNVLSQNFVLVSARVGSEIQSNLKQAGAEEYFYDLTFFANGKRVDLNGNYIQVVLPFENEKDFEMLSGKTITAYHYDENGENQTQVDATVTKCGVVISTNKAGYFKVVYGDDANDKFVYLSSVDGYGQVSSVALPSNIGKVSTNITVTFALSAGFEIEYVLLNGKNITSQVANNTLQILLSELSQNNALQVSFIAGQRKLIFAQNGFDSLDNEFVSNQQLEFVLENMGDIVEPDSSTKIVTLIVILGVWLVLCGGITLTIILIKKKTNKNESKENQE